MFCENCGNRLEENAKFCTFCGKPVSTITPQGVVLQRNLSEQTSAIQPEQPKVLQKLYGRLTASTVLWIIAGVLNIIVLKDNFSYWNLLSKISAIVEIIVVFCVALARFIDRTDIYTNICKIDEDYGEIPSSAGFIFSVWTCIDLALTWSDFGYLHPTMTMCLLLYVADILLINVYVKMHGTEIWKLAEMEQRKLEEQRIAKEKAESEEKENDGRTEHSYDESVENQK